MERQVWFEAWQMQCWGEPFRVGERIEIMTTPAVDRVGLTALLGRFVGHLVALTTE